MVEIFGHTYEHITVLRTFGDPVTMYMVQTDDGYYIHTEIMDENVYKTVTGIYSYFDPNAVIIIHESELPEGAEILEIGGGNTEIASIEEATEEDYIKALESMGVDFNG